MRLVIVAAALAGLTWISGCDALLVEPRVSPDPDVALSITASANAEDDFGDLTGVLAKIERVSFRFVTSDTVRDTLVAARLVDGGLQARVTIHADEARGWLEIRADLLGGPGSLFTGRALLETLPVVPTVRMAITPVASTVIGGPTPSLLTALGDTASLDGAVIFATGDTIHGARIEWSSEDPSIMEVVGDRAISRGNGRAMLTASALGATRTWSVDVRQVPVSLTGVAPSDTTVAVGETFRARAFGADRNGYPLLPGADASWAATGAVTVGEYGLVTALSTGTGQVEAVLGAARPSMTVTVIDP